MNRRIDWLRTPALAATVLVAAMSMACGGGGGGGGNNNGGGGLNASFTPDNSNPPATSVWMASGGGSGETFRVDIMVRDINDVAGVAFPLRFNTNDATFMSVDASGSALGAGGVNLDVQAAPSQSDPGVLLVVVSRQGAGNTGVDITGSQAVLTLTFRAERAVAGSDFDFDDTAGDRVVEVCPSPTMACNDVAANWFGGTLSAN
jgi:hypothetical protein